MKKIVYMILVSMFLGIAGCRTTDRQSAFTDCIFGDYANAQSRMEEYKNVIMVCVYEDSWEDKGPHEYALHRFKGTVVKVYKGDWSVCERVAFVHGVDSRAPAEKNRHAGDLMFVFTDYHGNEEFGVDAGDFLGYDPTLRSQMALLFPNAR
jgi:hypothetical protein